MTAWLPIFLFIGFMVLLNLIEFGSVD